MDFLSHLATESDRFRRALESTPADTPVPSCEGWTAADLLWHLTEVQHFWGTIVVERLSAPDAAEKVKPSPASDMSAGLDLFTEASRRLHGALESTPEDTPLWTWADDQSAGFVRRRQAHEAAIHRMDAELTAGGEVTPLSADFAADGIDELFGVYAGGVPTWGEFTPSSDTVALEATDADRRWMVTLGSMSGTSPNTGNVYEDLPALMEGADGGPTARLTGSASDLDGWLWGRIPLDRLGVEGSESAVASLRATIADATQ